LEDVGDEGLHEFEPDGVEMRKDVEGVGATTFGGDAPGISEEVGRGSEGHVRRWVGGVRPVEGRWCGVRAFVDGFEEGMEDVVAVYDVLTDRRGEGI
jgi:hypothetical protein